MPKLIDKLLVISTRFLAHILPFMDTDSLTRKIVHRGKPVTELDSFFLSSSTVKLSILTVMLKICACIGLNKEL